LAKGGERGLHVPQLKRRGTSQGKTDDSSFFKKGSRKEKKVNQILEAPLRRKKENVSIFSAGERGEKIWGGGKERNGDILFFCRVKGMGQEVKTCANGMGHRLPHRKKEPCLKEKSRHVGRGDIYSYRRGLAGGDLSGRGGGDRGLWMAILRVWLKNFRASGRENAIA